MTPVFVSHDVENAALRDLVCSVWGQAYDASTSALPGLIAPDAHVEIVFQMGSACQVVSGDRETQTPRAMVYALRHGALQWKPTGANSMVAIRLAPVVASVMLNAGLSGCWDRPVALSDLIGREAEDLIDRLAGSPLPLAGTVLETWLLSRLVGWSLDHERQMRLQSALMWEVAGEPMSALADALGYTDRTLRRYCATHAGLSPKQLVMSGRMLRACDLLRGRGHLPLAAVAQMLGFGDQAAFTNAFRHYLGMTPGELRSEPLVFYETPH